MRVSNLAAVLYITSLVAAGYLQMTNPENPTASNQKYKKVTTK